MKYRTSVGRVMLLCVSLFVLATWSGCNPIQVSDTATIYEELAEAKTEQQAKRAITSALRMAGIDDATEPSAFTGYALNESNLTNLSSSLAAYNTGDEAAGRTMRQVFDLAHEIGRAPSVDLDDALEIFVLASNYALNSLESTEDGSLQIFLAATVGSSLPNLFDQVDADALISPFQAFMFAIWLDRQGPGLVYYLDARSQFDLLGKVEATIPACVQPGNKALTLTWDWDVDSESEINCNDNLGGGSNANPCPTFCLVDSQCTLGSCGDSPNRQGCYENYVSCVNSTTDISICDGALDVCLVAHPT